MLVVVILNLLCQMKCIAAYCESGDIPTSLLCAYFKVELCIDLVYTCMYVHIMPEVYTMSTGQCSMLAFKFASVR